MFLPHKLTAYRKTSTKNTRGVVVQSNTLLYTDLPCMVRRSSNTLKDAKLGRDVDETKYDVITENRDFKVGDMVDITLTTSSIGEYIIETIDYNYSKVTNSVDNVYFTVKKRDAS